MNIKMLGKYTLGLFTANSRKGNFDLNAAR